MKLLLTPALFGALLWGASSLHAATPAPVKPPAKGAADKTNPPANAYGVYDFDKAKAEADKKKKPLVFIAYNERVEEAPVRAAVNRSYWTFWDDAVVILTRTTAADAWSRLPDPVQKSLKSPDLGKEYPKLIGFDQEATTPLLAMKAEQLLANDEKAMEKIAKNFKTASKTKTVSTEFPPPSLTEAAKPGAPAAPATPAKTETAPAAVPAVILIKDGKPENWTNTQGQTIQATLAEAGADKVVFVMANGSRVDYELAKLSDASKKRVEELKAASTPK
jgi:hypothetical protein